MKIYNSLEEAYDAYDYETILDYEDEIIPLTSDRVDTLASNVYSFLGEGYFYIGEYKQSTEYFDKELEILKQVYGDDIPDVEYLLDNLAIVYLEAGRYQKSEDLHREIVDIYAEKYGKKSEEYVMAVIGLGELYGHINKFDEAEDTYKKLLNELPKTNPSYPIIFGNLADLYARVGSFSQAERTYKKALNLLEKRSGINTPNYAAVLGNMGIYLLQTGRYPEAEEVLNRAINIMDRLGSSEDEESDYAGLLNNLAVVYDALGFYDRAANMFTELLEYEKNASGEDHPYYAIALGNLASVYTKLNKYSQSEEYYDQALVITKDALGANSSDYALLLKEKALLYKKIGKYAEAKRLLQRTVDIQKEVLGSHHPEYAKALYNLGDIYMIIEDVDNAEPILSEALKIREKELGKYHPNYAQSTRKMAVLNWHRKNYTETENYYKKTFDNYFHQIENYFPTLSEAEKAKFYNTKLKPTFEEFNSYSVTRSAQNPDLISKMYNYQLATKALIMYATNKVRESIINSGDSAIIQKYNQWLSEKEQLSKYYSLTLQELEERNINLEELVAHANKLEKELSASSQQFASTFSKKKVDWKDVRNQLKPGEAAIEVIRFRKFLPDSSGYFSDEVYYAALIVKSDTRDHPEIALIGNGKTLETRYLANYRNAIRFKVKEEFSYKLYWEPIGEKLEGINKIYFSPDGVYNQISIATFHNPATGNYLVDEITIQLLSNTKDLVAYNTPSQGSGQTILMGFPNYNKGVDKSAFKKEDDQEKETRGMRGMTRGSGLSRGMRGGSLSRGLRGGLQRLMRDGESISMLPGTKREVEYLAQLYSSRNEKFDTLLLDNAAEETIKAIKNPQTLHIATHGFFIEDVEPAEGEEEETTYIENPLLRSGLILAGANKLLTSAPALEGEEDGILTAYEAMNLYLDQTQLVVLSACETGLGEVTNGEGVYGLQRAFLVAGAKSIIMSMWSVDDDATQELMNLFYEDWLRTGEKLDAFRRAQQTLKKKYKDPFYWGAFVMIGT